MRYLSWIVTLPLTVLAISFAVSNMTPVQIGLWPFVGTVEVPAFTLVLVTLVLGFLMGGVTVWLGQHRHRKAARQHQARADRLQKELDGTRAKGVIPPTTPL